MKFKWDYSGVSDMCFSDSNQESYKKAALFLGDTVEDWGAGTMWAKRYFKNYRGIDGSPSIYIKPEDVVDLVEYTSDVENILMRQVLECNQEWRKIIDNVKKSFRKKLCITICTPLVKNTHIGYSQPAIKADGSKMEDAELFGIFFNKQDILDCFPPNEYILKEETIDVDIGYGKEWLLYVERR